MPGRPQHRRRRPEHRGRIDPAAEGEAGEDHDLVDGVVALDVAARVRLGVAEGLRLGEHVVVRAPELAHGGEDEVRRAVDDAADAEDGVRGEVRGERRQHRDPPADGGLEPEGRAGAPGDRLELGAVVGDDVLVGSHDRLAGTERGGHEGVGRLVAAHELDDGVDVGARHQVGRCVGDEVVGDAEGAGPGEVALRDAREDEAGHAAGVHPLGMLEEGAHDGSADGAGAEHRDAEGNLAGHPADRSRRAGAPAPPRRPVHSRA
jgi:hypothetical protein